ncbi:transcription initiation factor TFIID subunit 4B-like [Zophobas morio]|uniref:transcription initiation factor TFIID subunit 4B-like n=1 Tax=Zophobas morio TaxID=2755281 RepID=UPI003083B604
MACGLGMVSESLAKYNFSLNSDINYLMKRHCHNYINLVIKLELQELKKCKLKQNFYKGLPTSDANTKVLEEELKKEKDLRSFIDQHSKTLGRSQSQLLQTRFDTVRPTFDDSKHSFNLNQPATYSVPDPDRNLGSDLISEDLKREGGGPSYQDLEKEEIQFLHFETLKLKVADLAKRNGIKNVSVECCFLLSVALQQKLRSMIEKMFLNCNHRLESIRPGQGTYTTQDFKKRLQLFKKLDKIVFDKKQDEEREMIRKVEKSRLKLSDVDAQQLRQKAKQLRDEEEMKHTHLAANQTAMARILDINKKRRSMLSFGSKSSASYLRDLDALDQPATWTSSQASLATPLTPRRLRRVVLKDFVKSLEEDRDLAKSLLLHRALLRLH